MTPPRSVRVTLQPPLALLEHALIPRPHRGRRHGVIVAIRPVLPRKKHAVIRDAFTTSSPTKLRADTSRQGRTPDEVYTPKPL